MDGAVAGAASHLRAAAGGGLSAAAMSRASDRRPGNRRIAVIHAVLALGFFIVVILKYKVFGQ